MTAYISAVAEHHFPSSEQWEDVLQLMQLNPFQEKQWRALKSKSLIKALKDSRSPIRLCITYAEEDDEEMCIKGSMYWTGVCGPVDADGRVKVVLLNLQMRPEPETCKDLDAKEVYEYCDHEKQDPDGLKVGDWVFTTPKWTSTGYVKEQITGKDNSNKREIYYWTSGRKLNDYSQAQEAKYLTPVVNISNVVNVSIDESLDASAEPSAGCCQG